MTAEVAVRPGGEVAFPLDLPEVVVEITAMWLESRRSANTRDSYRRDIRKWFTYCARTGLDPLEMKVRHAELFARWLVERAVEKGEAPPKPKTVARAMATASAWYRYLIKNDAATRNPFAEADRPKIPAKHSETGALTREETHRLIEAADKDTGSAQLRTAALIRLLVQVGIRVSEAVDAQIEDLGYSRGFRTLRLTLKGDKPHVRRLPVETTYALDAYLADRAARAGVELRDFRGPLFATAGSRPMRREKAWELVSRIARQAGIESPVHPHTLRHTWATLAEEAGAKPREIQDALGHESFDTTLLYLERGRQLERDPSQLVAAVTE